MRSEEDLRALEALKGVFRVNLAAKSGERVLVFTDLVPEGAKLPAVETQRRRGLVQVALAAAEAGRALGLEVLHREFPALGSHGSEPPRQLWDDAFGADAVNELEAAGVLGPIAAKKASEKDVITARKIIEKHKASAVDAVVALSNYSTSHTRFRDLLTGSAGARYASMPLFEMDMLWGSMDVDWKAVEKRSLALAEAVGRGSSVRVTTPDGTDITFSIKGRTPRSDTGVLTEPGSFSNLPAGEVYLAPVEGTANGVLVINWAPNRRLKSPVKVTVKDGMAREVTGDEPYAAELTAGLDAAPLNRNIAELGIGTNDKADRPDNILESEKIMGTVHIAFGDNSSMGGTVSTPFHQDFVFFGPTLTVITDQGEESPLKDGRLMPAYL